MSVSLHCYTRQKPDGVPTIPCSTKYRINVVLRPLGDAYTPPSLPSIIPCASSIAVAIAIAMLTREVFQDKMSVLVPCKSVNARPRYPLRRNGLVPGLEVVELGGLNHEERMHVTTRARETLVTEGSK